MNKFLSVACLMLIVTNAQATIIASKPLDFATPWFGWYSDTQTAEVANGFSIDSAVVATSLVWWGAEFDSQPGHEFVFDIRFYNDAGGLPAEVPFYAFTTELLSGLFVGTDTETPLLNSPTVSADNYRYETHIPDALFATADDYWLSISAHARSQFVWSHATSASSELHYRDIRGGESFWSTSDFGQRNDNAFILSNADGTLPLPAPWLLLLPTVLLLMANKQRRK